MNINKASSSKDKVIKEKYAKAKAIHASSMGTSEVTSNHQVHAKKMVEQPAKQVSQTMPKSRSTISTPDGVSNTKPPKYARSTITPQALKSEDNSSLPKC